MHAEPWIESALDVRDRNGASVPGYGWIFPVGDGTINDGIGLRALGCDTIAFGTLFVFSSILISNVRRKVTRLAQAKLYDRFVNVAVTADHLIHLT